MKLNPGEALLTIAVTLDRKLYRKEMTKQAIAAAVKDCIERYDDQDFAKWQEEDGMALVIKVPLSRHRKQ